MQPVSVLTADASLQVRTPMLKKRKYILCIWAAAAAVAVSHGTFQFFQPVKQSGFQMPSQFQFRPQTTQWSPFGQPEQPGFIWPFGGNTQSDSAVFTASTVAQFVGVISAVFGIALAFNVDAPAGLESAQIASSSL